MSWTLERNGTLDAAQVGAIQEVMLNKAVYLKVSGNEVMSGDEDFNERPEVGIFLAKIKGLAAMTPEAFMEEIYSSNVPILAARGGKLVLLNPAANSIFGLPDGETFTGQSPDVTVAESDREQHDRTLRLLVQRSQTQDGSTVVRHPIVSGGYASDGPENIRVRQDGGTFEIMASVFLVARDGTAFACLLTCDVFDKENNYTNRLVLGEEALKPASASRKAPPRPGEDKRL